MLKINFKPETKNLILIIIRDLFFGALALLAIFSLMEIIKPRIVLNYINLDVFLLIVIFLGVITAVFYQPQPKEKSKLKFWGNLTVLLISVLIGIACVYLARSLGYLSILVGIATAIISYYLIILCLEE
jgi:amino acid transporter